MKPTRRTTCLGFVAAALLLLAEAWASEPVSPEREALEESRYRAAAQLAQWPDPARRADLEAWLQDPPQVLATEVLCRSEVEVPRFPYQRAARVALWQLDRAQWRSAWAERAPEQWLAVAAGAGPADPRAAAAKDLIGAMEPAQAAALLEKLEVLLADSALSAGELLAAAAGRSGRVPSEAALAQISPAHLQQLMGVLPADHPAMQKAIADRLPLLSRHGDGASAKASPVAGASEAEQLAAVVALMRQNTAEADAALADALEQGELGNGELAAEVRRWLQD